jgi:hypothetical protein
LKRKRTLNKSIITQKFLNITTEYAAFIQSLDSEELCESADLIVVDYSEDELVELILEYVDFEDDSENGIKVHSEGINRHASPRNKQSDI